MLRRRKKHGQSLIEFVSLTVVILMSFIVFQKYIVRGISGRWKAIGDSWSYGKIFDPHHTIECAYDPLYTNSWFNRTCYDLTCKDECLRSTMTPAACGACVVACNIPECN